MSITEIRQVLSQQLGMILTVISVVIGFIALYVTLRDKGKKKWSVILLCGSLLMVAVLVANYITMNLPNDTSQGEDYTVNTSEEVNYTVSNRKAIGEVEFAYSESEDELDILIKWQDNSSICDSMIADYRDYEFTERDIEEAIEIYPVIWANEGVTMQRKPQAFIELGFHPGELYGKTIYVLILNFNKDCSVDSYSIVTIPGAI